MVNLLSVQCGSMLLKPVITVLKNCVVDVGLIDFLYFLRPSSSPQKWPTCYVMKSRPHG